jgi:hypothetical protein
MAELFAGSLWPSLISLILLYISDYSLTIYCARLYQTRAKDKLVLEGSYELTPYYQRDVDSLRRFSPRFLFALCAISIGLAAIWWISLENTGMWVVYQLASGMLILPQLAVHVRHVRNVVTFQTAFSEDGVRGRIEYPRWVGLRISSTELWGFAALYLVVFAITGSLFVIGGVVMCASLARKHGGLSRKARVATQSAELAVAAGSEPASAG